uniref:Mini-chromosome maintenance complex-binding protein n=1 Tax=Clastoptera arizonana TaxID=38151 RepID=A0A1B6E8K5_9HEMI
MMDNLNFDSNFLAHNTESCLSKLNKEENWNRLPLINSCSHQNLKDGQLVRFRGMIQDMYNPVLYFSSYAVRNTKTNETLIRCGKYKDSLEYSEEEEFLFESEDNINKERRSVYCVSIPALNDWAKLPLHTSNESLVNHENAGAKRNMEIDEEESSDKSESNITKRLCSSQESASNKQVANGMEYDLNLPIPNLMDKACIINLYDEDGSNLKLNDVVEVAGFLSFDSSTTCTINGDFCTDDEIKFPPSSIVPRLHAVLIKDAMSFNPPSNLLSTDDVWQNAAYLQKELKLVLTQVLFGDILAADYLILHLLSTVYKRQDMMALGKCSLNLSNIPSPSLLPGYTKKLYSLLSELLHKSHFLPMSLTNMNSVDLIPKKNYETNKLISGQLQLSNKTHLVLDETCMEAGKLDEKGVRNIQALGNLITFQKLDYNFQFYPVEIDTNIPVLILSEGKSMLNSDCHVVLQPDKMCLLTINETFEAAKHFMKDPLLSRLRFYLSSIPFKDHEIPSDLQKVIHEDFVKLRQNDNKFSGDDLHILLVLARLHSLSKGQQLLTHESWQTVQDMEEQRKSRIIKK